MRSSWNIGAVLLDMDGTLLDTEKLYFESLMTALETCGYTDDTAALCHSMIGIPGPECEVMLRERYGEDFPLAHVDRLFRAGFDEILKAGLPLKSGAVELRMRCGRPTARWRSSPPRRGVRPTGT